MDKLETICGIPTKIFSKSFPGVHKNLFKFLFRNDPIIKLVRIAPNKTLKIKPEVVKKSEELLHLTEPENLVNLGEVQIPDVKFKVEYLGNDIETKERDKGIEPDQMIKEEQTSQIDVSPKDLGIESPEPKPDSNHKNLPSSSHCSEIKLEFETSLLVKKEPGKKFELTKFKCDICNKLFSTIYHLKAHKLTHIENRERPFKCTKRGCNKAFFLKSSLYKHKRNCHGELPFICPEEGCEKAYLKGYQLIEHKMVSHKFNPETKCDICNKSVSSKNYLKIHKRRHLVKAKNRERPFKCKEDGCDKDYFDKSHLKRHMMTCHNLELNVKQIQCGICKKMVSSNYKLKRHKETHLGPKVRERSFKCKEIGCDKAYFESSHLNHHKKICHMTIGNSKNLVIERIGDFQCTKCGKEMIKTKYKTYMFHERNCKPNQMCEFCPKIFNSGRELQKHRNTHTKERKYECGDCDAVFYRTECLLSHKRVHLKKKPFPCSIKGCSKSYPTNAILTQHMKDNHEKKERELKCPHCSKIYSKINSFRYHIYTKHKASGKNKIYKCEIEGCGEAFSSPIRLQKHEVGHNEGTNKSYLCSKCGKSFESFSRWNNHEMNYCKK